MGRVEWLDGDVDLSADDAAALARGESASADQSEEHDQTVEWIRDTLTGCELPATEVIERGKNEQLVSRSTLLRAFKRCGGKPRKDGAGPWLWGLPDISELLNTERETKVA